MNRLSIVTFAALAMATLRVEFPDTLVPLLAGGSALILAICLASMGIRKFFNRPVSWRDTLLITGFGAAGLCFFTFVHVFLLGFQHREFADLGEVAR